MLSFGGAVVAAGIAVIGYGVLRRREPVVPDRRSLLLALAAGLILLVLSFAAYLVLADADSLWRTQFLGGIGSGLLLTAAAGLLALAARRRSMQVGVAALVAGVVSYFGVSASFTMASFHFRNWQRTRTAMAEVVGFAPRLKPDTLVTLTGVPKEPTALGSADPFSDNMWFDMSVRLAYPHDPVAGVYFYANGTPAPHENMALKGDLWVDDGTGFPTCRASPSSIRW